MKIIKNALTPEECKMFREYWDNNQNLVYVNWEEAGEVLDRRLTIGKKSPLWDRILRIVGQDFKEPIEIWAAYQNQRFAHNVHTDEYHKERTDANVYTYVVTTLTEPKFKTLIWKDLAPDNTHIFRHLESWGENLENETRVSNISETEDLDHTPERDGKYFVDYLDLEGIYTYQLGDAVLFNGRKYHCTSNWKKYPEFTHRELLQIHVLTKESVD